MSSILDFISRPVKVVPVMFGPEHIAMLVITLLAAIGICCAAPRVGDKTHRAVLLFSAGLLLVFEIIKQVILVHMDGAAGYNLHHLPFQPCSSLMYSILLVGILYNAKSRFWKGLREILVCYTVVFGFFSGMCAVVYPDGLFVESVSGLWLYQSLQHHVVLALMAVYLSVCGKFRFCKDSYRKAFYAFAGYCILAFVLNLTCYSIWKNPNFNMMYVGPYKLWTIPLVSLFVTIRSYLVYLPTYFFGYTLCAFVVSAGCCGAQKLAQRLYPKTVAP